LGELAEEAKEAVNEELKRGFRPEFLNRIDEIVMFKPLSRDEIAKIIRLALADIEKRLEDRGIKLDATDDAIDFIAEAAYSPVYGARPVKRYLQKHVETEVGRMIIKGDITDGTSILLDAQNGKLEIRPLVRV